MPKINKPPARSFEESIAILKERAQEETIYIKTLFEVFARRGFPLFIIVLALPFCQPIQIPGMSTPFGLVIAFLGFRLLFGQKIWLPKWLRDKPLSKQFLNKVLFRSLRFVKKCDKLCRSRLVFFAKNPVMYGLNCFLTIVLGLFLALPLPIPLSNIAAGWALLFLHFGLLEDDGLLIILSYIITAICIGFFVGIYWLFK